MSMVKAASSGLLGLSILRRMSHDFCHGSVSVILSAWRIEMTANMVVVKNVYRGSFRNVASFCSPPDSQALAC